MKRFISASAVVVVIAFPAMGQTARDLHQAMLTTYCVTCHNARLKTGGLALDGLDLAAAANDAQIWEKALRKLRGHQMPPPGSPQPSQKDVDSFVVWMENAFRLKCRRHSRQWSQGGLCADSAPEPHRVRRDG
jgi:mono/diheme cytochrome c family protein